MNDPAILPDLTRPMSGIVEAVCPGLSWEAFPWDHAGAENSSRPATTSRSVVICLTTPARYPPYLLIRLHGGPVMKPRTLTGTVYGCS
jgi:hypothetical protein